jgi:uncharacterized protein
MQTFDALAFLVIFFSMLLRTVTGFGSALISIPLLSLLFGAKFAIPFILIYECLIDLMILSRNGFEARAESRKAIPLLIGGIVGVVLGTEVLILSGERVLRISIGIALILFSLLMLKRINLRIENQRSSYSLAGLVGGFLCSSIGMPGPPVALILSSQGLSKESFRRVIVVFLTAIDFINFIYFILIGLITGDMLVQSLKFIPALILGFALGDFVFARCSEIQFRKVVMAIIIAAGILLISSAIQFGNAHP